MIWASWRGFRYDRKCPFSCIYNPQNTVSPTSSFSASFNGNRVKNHPSPWTCPLRTITDEVPRTSASTFTQLLSSGAVLAQSCLCLYSSLQHLVHFHVEYVLLAEVYPIISLAVVFLLSAVCRLCVFLFLFFCLFVFCFVFVFVCLFVFPSSLAPVVAGKRRSGAPRTQKLRFIPMRFRAFDRFRVVF